MGNRSGLRNSGRKFSRAHPVLDCGFLDESFRWPRWPCCWSAFGPHDKQDQNGTERLEYLVAERTASLEEAIQLKELYLKELRPRVPLATWSNPSLRKTCIPALNLRFRVRSRAAVERWGVFTTWVRSGAGGFGPPPVFRKPADVPRSAHGPANLCPALHVEQFPRKIASGSIHADSPKLRRAHSTHRTVDPHLCVGSRGGIAGGPNLSKHPPRRARTEMKKWSLTVVKLHLVQLEDRQTSAHRHEGLV